MKGAILELATESTGFVFVSVEKKEGNVVIWCEGMDYGLYFTPAEWEKVSVHVLESYKELNKTK